MSRSGSITASIHSDLRTIAQELETVPGVPYSHAELIVRKVGDAWEVRQVLIGARTGAQIDSVKVRHEHLEVAIRLVAQRIEQINRPEQLDRAD